MMLVCFNHPLHRQNLQFLTFTFIQHYFFFFLPLFLLLGFLIADFISIPRIPNIADLDVTSLITKGEKPGTGTMKYALNVIFIT